MVLATGSNSTKYKYFPQWIATIGAFMLMQQTGQSLGWTSPNLMRLTSENSTIPITLSEASWVASNLNLGRFLGALLCPVLLELLGSKNTVLFLFIPMAVSWTMLIIAKGVWWLYISRFIQGITMGMTGCLSVYLGEMSVPAIRGTLISIAMYGASIGSVVSSALESYLSMPVSSSIYLGQCLVAIILFAWLPQSPYHLVKRNKLESARKAIIWYRGDYEVDKEIDAVKGFVQCKSKQSVIANLREFKSPPIRQATILVLLLFIFPNMSGFHNVVFYMEMILIKGKSFLIDSKEFVIYANMFSIIATGFAAVLIDRLGRRILMLISSVGATVSLISLGLHFYLLDLGINSESIQWLPIASIILFRFTYSIGFLSVPDTVLSEIFPASVKSVVTCMSSLISAFFAFVGSKMYQPLVDSVGNSYVFWIHAVFAIAAIPTVVFLQPETKGKTFQEIQNEIHKKK